MYIVKISLNSVVDKKKLPVSYENHSCQTSSFYSQITGEDWRDYNEIPFNYLTHKKDGYIITDSEVTDNIIPLTELEIQQRLNANRELLSVSMRQARLTLYRHNLLSIVEETINSIGGEALLEWNYSSSVNRNNPLVSQVALASGMTEEDIDLMFNEAIEL